MTKGALILAAGASTRFGRAKQLALFDGETLLRRAARTALEADCSPVIVVIGCRSEEIGTALEGLDVRTAHNDRWADGIGTSIRCGVNEILRHDPGLNALIVMTCDQPLVTANTLGALAAALVGSEGSIVASAYAGTLGIPALFRSVWFEELRSLPAGAGAKYLLEAHRPEVVPVAFPDGVRDIDFPADLERISVRGAISCESA